MRELLTFSRKDMEGPGADLTFTRVLETGAPPTNEIGDAALRLMTGQMRELRLREPGCGSIEIFSRVATAHPGAWGIIWAGFVGGYADADAAAEFYAMEGA